MRTVFLALAVGFWWTGPLSPWLRDLLSVRKGLPAWAAGVLPGLSGLSALGSVVAERGLSLRLAALLLPLPFLVVALWKARIFCNWVCPLGTLYALPSRWSRKTPILRRRVNGILFWAVVGMAAVGAPLALILDPLVTFHRLGPLVRGVGLGAGVFLLAWVPVFFALSFLQPRLWCTHICPLGYGFDFVHRLRKRLTRRAQSETPVTGRREVLAGLVVGLPLAGLARALGPLGPKAAPPVLPPGAGNPDRFAALCSRCYACVNACPTRVIQPAVAGGRPLLEAFAPVLDTDASYCEQFCTRCGEACPTGAIQSLTEDEKGLQQIGVARVIQDACLAWADGEYCMVCSEFCPYFAIDTDTSPDGLARPGVNPDRCRGCGSCHSECPAVRQGKAIVVDGIDRQARVADPS